MYGTDKNKSTNLALFELVFGELKDIVLSTRVISINCFNFNVQTIKNRRWIFCLCTRICIPGFFNSFASGSRQNASYPSWNQSRVISNASKVYLEFCCQYDRPCKCTDRNLQVHFHKARFWGFQRHYQHLNCQFATSFESCTIARFGTLQLSKAAKKLTLLKNNRIKKFVWKLTKIRYSLINILPYFDFMEAKAGAYMSIKRCWFVWKLGGLWATSTMLVRDYNSWTNIPLDITTVFNVCEHFRCWNDVDLKLTLLICWARSEFITENTET